MLSVRFSSVFQLSHSQVEHTRQGFDETERLIMRIVMFPVNRIVTLHGQSFTHGSRFAQKTRKPRLDSKYARYPVLDLMTCRFSVYLFRHLYAHVTS